MSIKYPKGKSGRPNRAPSPQDLQSVVRRMGYVVQKFHEAAMSSLLAADQQGMAEEFNDNIKPVVDWLLRFEFEPGDDDETLPG